MAKLFWLKCDKYIANAIVAANMLRFIANSKVMTTDKMRLRYGSQIFTISLKSMASSGYADEREDILASAL